MTKVADVIDDILRIDEIEETANSAAGTEVSDDLTPQLGGDLDCNAKSLNNSNAIFFKSAGLFDNGTKTAGWTILPANGQYQKVTINGACTLSITAPPGPTTLYLHVHQGSTGGALTLPTGKWTGGTVKANTLTPTTGHDILMIHFYGGTNYVFDYILNIS